MSRGKSTMAKGKVTTLSLSLSHFSRVETSKIVGVGKKNNIMK